MKYTDFTGKDVFEDVTTNPSIFVIKNSRQKNNKIKINDRFYIPQDKLNESIWTFHHPKILNLKDKIMDEGIMLKDWPNIKIFRGILTGYDKAFIIDENTKNNLLSADSKNKDITKPLVRGKDLKKYRINYMKLYLILTSIGVPIENYPSIKGHLDQYQERLQKRYDKGKNWWELRACNYYKEFKKEKIMWGNLSIGPNFAYCADELYTTAPANFLIGDNLKYLLAILNSKITFFIFKLIGVKVDSGYGSVKNLGVDCRKPLFGLRFLF